MWRPGWQPCWPPVSPWWCLSEAYAVHSPPRYVRPHKFHQTDFGILFVWSMVISAREPTCESVNLWRLYSAAPPIDQTTNTINWYPTQSHYPGTDGIGPCPVWVMWTRKQHISIWKSLVWLDHVSNWGVPIAKTGDAKLIWPSCLVWFEDDYQWGKEVMTLNQMEYISDRIWVSLSERTATRDFGNNSINLHSNSKTRYKLSEN